MIRGKLIHNGTRFHKLVVIGKSTKTDSNRNSYYFCKCDCGKDCEIRSTHLRNEHTKSCGCLTMTDPGHASWNKLFWQYNDKAKRRGFSFSLSFDQFKELAQKACSYCGDAPKRFNLYATYDGIIYDNGYTQNMVDRAWIYTNGIDRIDNSKGYELDNSVTCCTICNSFKSDYKKENFLAHAEKITLFQKSLDIPHLPK